MFEFVHFSTKLIFRSFYDKVKLWKNWFLEDKRCIPCLAKTQYPRDDLLLFKPKYAMITLFIYNEVHRKWN